MGPGSCSRTVVVMAWDWGGHVPRCLSTHMPPILSCAGELMSLLSYPREHLQCNKGGKWPLLCTIMGKPKAKWSCKAGAAGSPRSAERIATLCPVLSMQHPSLVHTQYNSLLILQKVSLRLPLLTFQYNASCFPCLGETQSRSPENLLFWLIA